MAESLNKFIDLIKQKKNLAIRGLGLGEQAYLSSFFSRPLVFIVPNSDIANKINAQLLALKQKSCVLANFDKLFLSSSFQSRDNQIELIKTLSNLATNNADILVTTPEVLFLKLCSQKTFKNICQSFVVGKDYEYEKVIKKLSDAKYERVPSVSQVGEFAVRGDIIDVFSANFEDPIRLSFFGNNLETAYCFDSFNGSKKQILKKFFITPNYIPNENETIDVFSFLQTECVCLQNSMSLENVLQSEKDAMKKRIEVQFAKEEEQDFQFQDYDFTLQDKLKNKNFVLFDNTQNFFNYEFDEFFDEKCIKFDDFLYKIELLIAETKKYVSEKKIILCLDNQNTFNAIQNIFTKMHVNFSTNQNDIGLILTLNTMPFNVCFEHEQTLYIGSTNFAHKKSFKPSKTAEIKFLPKAGEYVVHTVHGIGLCEGVVNLKVGGIEKDFFKLKYRGDGVLYVPIENTDALSLYMSDNRTVSLNKLGGKEFAQIKDKAQKAVDDMAKELLQLYSVRDNLKGYKYPEDDYLYTEFEQAFAYDETPDQAQAILDVKRDMQSDRIMDRLICGDVGYGKTEVAIRAMFKAVLEGKQVAVLAPTTILSLQHYVSIVERLKNFDVRVEMLNRFKSQKEQKKIIEDLKVGKVNIVCGTHRLLSQDVKFDDLGLLVLDEEQRFGVKAKEKIKQMKTDVDVLALSATPIPRTLNMALLALRDISIINTPPKDRLAVKTYVMTYNLEIMAQAINAEVLRGGQVLVVFNDIDKIYTLCAELKKAVGNDDVVFDVAHGQMPEVVLENAIKRLYDKQTQVLVSTTLIENGIDLPKANTLIVLNSHRLGLGQMYQLRGRVGRSTEQAYAYFTYPRDAVLTPEASSRLETIAEHTELGSGFKIAMRDLQLRGAGELLGRYQHGHMIKVGYDLYVKLLAEATKKLKGEKVQVLKDVKIDIALPAFIPANFIIEETERLKVYSQISAIQNEQDQKSVLDNIKNTYGKLPSEVLELSNVALIKSFAEQQNIKTIKIDDEIMRITYYKEDFSPEIVLKKLEKFAKFRLEKQNLPTISYKENNFSIQNAQVYLINYLKY